MQENNFKNNKSGFTLVEVVIVMAIFLLIIGVAISIFLSIIQGQKNILSEQKVVNQISYAEEYMSRALRMAKVDNDGACIKGPNDETGYAYLLTRPDPQTGLYRGIKFINQTDNNSCQEFFLDNDIYGNTSSQLVLKELKNSTDDNQAVALTSNDLNINYIKFSINGSDGSVARSPIGVSKGDAFQPRITILLNMQILGDQDGPTKVIQTTVSQRNLNINQ
jgi:prepilin-type N-terminal cleavage/methylation domain-containing protein